MAVRNYWSNFAYRVIDMTMCTCYIEKVMQFEIMSMLFIPAEAIKRCKQKKQAKQKWSRLFGTDLDLLEEQVRKEREEHFSVVVYAPNIPECGYCKRCGLDIPESIRKPVQIRARLDLEQV